MFYPCHSFHPEPRWFTSTNILGTQAPEAVRYWLEDEGSLTQRVVAACDGQFSVYVHKQKMQRSFYGEANLLQTRHDRLSVIREVELRCDQSAWVFARTIMPTSSLQGPARRLTMLGNRPLGAILFADPKVKRGQTQYARLNPGQVLYESAVSCIKQRPECLWGRRTVFRLADKPLLVNEIFLPAILKEARV